jgi:rhomboid family GlyGly-CTERM serine protease
LAAAGRRSGVSLLLGGLAIVVFVSTTATEHLQFERAAIQAGELWRLITGHWTHWSIDHLGWDVFAFVVLAAGCERTGRARLLACVIASSLAISLGVMVLRPDLAQYRGLSGVDSALFVLLAMDMIRRSVMEHDRPQTVILGGCLVAFMLKVGFELYTGSTVFVDSAHSGMEPLALAHVIGGGVGIVFAFSRSRRRAVQPPDIDREQHRVRPAGVDAAGVAGAAVPLHGAR